MTFYLLIFSCFAGLKIIFRRFFRHFSRFGPFQTVPRILTKQFRHDKIYVVEVVLQIQAFCFAFVYSHQSHKASIPNKKVSLMKSKVLAAFLCFALLLTRLCSCTGRADRHLAFGIRGSQPGCGKFLSALRQFLSFSPLQKLLL